MIGALPYAAEFPLTLLNPASELIVNVAPATSRVEAPSTYTGTSTVCPGTPSTVSITHVASPSATTSSSITIAPLVTLTFSVMRLPFVSDTTTFAHSTGIVPLASAGTSYVSTMITALSAAALPLPSACANANSFVAALFVIGALPYAAELPLTLLKPAPFAVIVNVAPATSRVEAPSTNTGTSTVLPGVPLTVSITHAASPSATTGSSITIAPLVTLTLDVMMLPFVSDTVTSAHSTGIVPLASAGTL